MGPGLRPNLAIICGLHLRLSFSIDHLQGGHLWSLTGSLPWYLNPMTVQVHCAKSALLPIPEERRHAIKDGRNCQRSTRILYFTLDPQDLDASGLDHWDLDWSGFSDFKARKRISCPRILQLIVLYERVLRVFIYLWSMYGDSTILASQNFRMNVSAFSCTILVNNAMNMASLLSVICMQLSVTKDTFERCVGSCQLRFQLGGLMDALM